MRRIHETSLKKLVSPPAALFQSHGWVLRNQTSSEFKKCYGYELSRDQSAIDGTIRRWIVESLSKDPTNNDILIGLAQRSSDFVSDIHSAVEILYNPQLNIEEVSTSLRGLIFPTQNRNVRNSTVVSMRKPLLRPYPFQIEMKNKIQSSIKQNSSSMLVLPTGTGKTRIVLQSILEMLALGDINKVIWLSDREFLLEQTRIVAVEMWEDLDTKGTKWNSRELNILSPNESLISLNWQSIPKLRFQTVQYLQENFQTIGEILSDAVLIFDEVHRGCSRNIKIANKAKEIGTQVIGLTATPTEISNETYTDLTTTFEKILLPEGVHIGDDKNFEREGYISKINLLLGSDILSDGINFEKIDFGNPRDHFKTSKEIIGWLKENDMWPTIWFNNSIAQAQICAAIGESQGIPSTHLSGNTNRKFAKSVLHDFSLGNYNLITNADLLTAGMDVPKIKCVVIDRNLDSESSTYKQIIGRGRRGLKMGGLPECLVIEVRK